MPTIDLTDAELAALTALIRRAIEQDRFPHAPRLDLLRAALAKTRPQSPAPKAGLLLSPPPRTTSDFFLDFHRPQP